MRLLVFRTGHLGDTVVAIPAFHAVRQAFPDAHIALLSNSDLKTPSRVAARDVLPEAGLFDDWLTYPSGAGGLGAMRSFAALIRTLRRQRFDAVVYLMTRNRSAARVRRDRLFFRAAGIPRVLGESHLLEELVDPDQQPPLPMMERESDFFLATLAAEGIPASSRSSDMLLSEGELQAADAWLAESCGRNFRSRTLLALAPGSNWESKVWREENFIQVATRLIERHSVVPVVFGGPEDRPKGEAVVAALGSGANAAGVLGVRAAAAAMRHAGLYLGNDNGTMHLAAAVGVPCVAIFAAIDFPGRWYPWGNGHRVFRVAVECEGCLTPACFNEHRCLEAILPEQVFRACDEILSR